MFYCFVLFRLFSFCFVLFGFFLFCFSSECSYLYNNKADRVTQKFRTFHAEFKDKQGFIQAKNRVRFF